MSPAIFSPSPYVTYSTLYWSLPTVRLLGPPDLYPCPLDWDPALHLFGPPDTRPGFRQEPVGYVEQDLVLCTLATVWALLGMNWLLGELTATHHTGLDPMAYQLPPVLTRILQSIKPLGPLVPHPHSPLPVYFFLPMLALLRPNVPVQKPAMSLPKL